MKIILLLKQKIECQKEDNWDEYLAFYINSAGMIMCGGGMNFAILVFANPIYFIVIAHQRKMFSVFLFTRYKSITIT